MKADGWDDPQKPPVEAIDLGDRVWVSWAGPFNRSDEPLIWHFCDRSVIKQRDTGRLSEWYEPQWVPVGVQGHTLVAREPLHLEPSILWPDCCGKHGFIREGRWQGV